MIHDYTCKKLTNDYKSSPVHIVSVTHSTFQVAIYHYSGSRSAPRYSCNYITVSGSSSCSGYNYSYSSGFGSFIGKIR